MNPQTVSAGAGVAVLAAVPVLPGEALFLLACYGAGTAVGQVVALALGLRSPAVKEGRIAASFGLVFLLAALAYLLFIGVS